MRKKDRQGFTLAELLIVVVIIGVLVAISIPIFTAQLRKAKLAANQANARAAYAACAVDYMKDPTEIAFCKYDIGKSKAEPTDKDAGVVDYYYDDDPGTGPQIDKWDVDFKIGTVDGKFLPITDKVYDVWYVTFSNEKFYESDENTSLLVYIAVEG